MKRPKVTLNADSLIHRAVWECCTHFVWCKLSFSNVSDLVWSSGSSAGLTDETCTDLFFFLHLFYLCPFKKRRVGGVCASVALTVATTVSTLHFSVKRWIRVCLVNVNCWLIGYNTVGMWGEGSSDACKHPSCNSWQPEGKQHILNKQIICIYGAYAHCLLTVSA